jgi:hypothetical protein
MANYQGTQKFNRHWQGIELEFETKISLQRLAGRTMCWAASRTIKASFGLPIAAHSFKSASFFLNCSKKLNERKKQFFF